MTQYFFAQALQKQGDSRFKSVKIKSAGLFAQEGMPATPEAIEVMMREGLDLRSHRSTQVDGGMIEDADLIITMTRSQKDQLTKSYPYKKDKIFTLGEMAGYEDFELSDPFGQGLAEYIKTFEQIKKMVNIIVERLAE